MIRLLSLGLAFVSSLVASVFTVNALMVTYKTIFAQRDALLALVFALGALVVLKAGESMQFAWDDWRTQKIQRAVQLLRTQEPTYIASRIPVDWMSPYNIEDTQELERVR